MFKVVALTFLQYIGPNEAELKFRLDVKGCVWRFGYDRYIKSFLSNTLHGGNH